MGLATAEAHIRRMRDEAVHTLLVAEQMRLEPERMAKEAKYVAAMDPKQRADYLNDIEKQRGKAAGDLLRDEVRQQWAAAVKA